MPPEEKDNSSPLFLTIAVIVITILSSFLVVRHFDLKANFSKWFSPKSYDSYDEVYEVKKSPEKLLISRENPESISLFEKTELRRLFEDEQFEKLNSVLAQYQEIFENDQADEYKVYDAYDTFYYTDSFYEDLYRNWINATPDAYQPYLAIANYYYLKGWESRGHKWAKDTSEKQFEDMRLNFEKAVANLYTALEINPNLVVAYNNLIGMYNANGDDELIDRVVEKMNLLFPYSFIIKAAILNTKEPRWGGSYRQMEEFARQAEKFSDKNPRMAILYGFIYSDQAKRFAHKKQYEKALKLYTKALDFGDHGTFYNERARIYYYNLKLYDQALENVNRSIELRPVLYEYPLMRSRIYYSLKDFDKAFSDLHTVETIKPGNSEAKKWKKWASKNMVEWGHYVFKEDIQKALEYYGVALEFDESNYQAYHWRGVVKTRLNDFESSLSDFQAAIEKNPHYFESYHMIDYVLAKEHKWDEIIHYWDSFIELEPDHAEAYFERSGTHYHNNDMVSAMHDLKKACELGNKKACGKYNEIGK